MSAILGNAIILAVLGSLVVNATQLPLSIAAAETPLTTRELAAENARLRAEVTRLRARLRAIRQPNSPAVSKEIAALRFTAVFQNTDDLRSIGEFSVNGPMASTLRPLHHKITKIAVDLRGERVFGRGHHDVYTVPNVGQPDEIKQDPEMPEISWLSAIVYDSTRQRLLASTFGGQGYLYAFDTETKEWSIVAKPGLGVSALAYAESDDLLYGVNLAAGPNETIDRLFTFNAKGVRTSEVELSQAIPTGGDFGHTQLVWDKGWLFLIQPNPKGRSRDSDAPLRGFLIQPDTGVVRLSHELWLQ